MFNMPQCCVLHCLTDLNVIESSNRLPLGAFGPRNDVGLKDRIGGTNPLEERQ